MSKPITYHTAMLGSHLSIAGGLHNALIQARELGMDCVQIFTKNQRQWNAPPFKAETIDAWHEAREATGIHEVVSHDSYLINLASPDPTTHGKSMTLFADELDRCESLSIDYLVTHPGAHVGQGEQAGLERVASSLDALLADRPDNGPLVCLETTAGQGTSLGAKLEELAWLLEHTQQSAKLGICLDTAHLLAAGYDLTSEAGAKATLDEIDQRLGMERVKVVHLNDSKVPMGSRKDRHEHIGHGHVSLEAFKIFCQHPHLQSVPGILETAKETAPDGRPWDVVNLETLRGL